MSDVLFSNSLQNDRDLHDKTAKWTLISLSN